MRLSNIELRNFIKRIKLPADQMGPFRDQMNNLRDRLSDKIDEDDKTGIRVTKFLIAGSWKKHTILRPSGDHPIDIDLVLFVEGDQSLANDLESLHDFIVEYLQAIYPTKDIARDTDAEGKTKSIKVKFIGTGMELDIVPVVPLDAPPEYVWQPERGGGGKYITSIAGQLAFFATRRRFNPSITGIVRAIKWWRNYKELKPSKFEPGLSSYAIELIASYLDLTKGVEENIEEAIIRFFQFVATSDIKTISFAMAINSVAQFQTPIFIGDPTNNENNVAKKLTDQKWQEIREDTFTAWEALNIAQARNNQGDTAEEWKSVFGPSFSIKP
ncbi:MAG TPA: CBASS oligonucleotide cyclase [Pyrinomonadaceae bacterium]|nr:CBASS oligonucleotide cyclase [Pyrinomonadaceae bacterium]